MVIKRFSLPVNDFCNFANFMAFYFDIIINMRDRMVPVYQFSDILTSVTVI